MFGIATAAIFWSLLREYMLHGRLPEPLNIAFHFPFLESSVTAMLVRNPRPHEAIARVMTSAFAAYILPLFARL